MTDRLIHSQPVLRLLHDMLETALSQSVRTTLATRCELMAAPPEIQLDRSIVQRTRELHTTYQ